MVVIKIVDELLMTGEDSEVESFYRKSNNKFEHGTNVRGPSFLIFYSLTMIHNDDYSTVIHGDEK